MKFISRVPLWQSAWIVIAKSKWWQFCLITIGSLSNIIYPHVPLVGFAAVAGNTLTLKKALITTISIWLTNQIYGFTIRKYPHSFESFTWGIVMGCGTALVTYLVTKSPRFTKQFWGYLLWLAISLVGGYGVYQSSILLVAQLMGGHGFTTAILWGIFVKNLRWAIGLSILHGCGAWLVMQAIPHQYFPHFTPISPDCEEK